MGAWFLATAFSNFLAGLIAQLTGVSAEGVEAQVIPSPRDTVHLYGDVFGQIALIAVVSALVCLALSPLLTRWMHSNVGDDAESAPGNPEAGRPRAAVP
jgi:POT family proton-dependent oligopeptide transporter